MTFNLSEVDPTWHPFFSTRIELINSILAYLPDSNFTPAREDIFRSFRTPLDQIRVVIFGQDPYPGPGIADGLAFSSKSDNAIPASLRNIFREYSDDLDLPTPTSPDLSPWSRAGVMLLNRSLTTEIGRRNAHLATNWRSFTLDVAGLLSERDVVAILWGNYAQELAPIFVRSIQSPHPSPLSAHRGFLGSKPFSAVNELLISQGRAPISWNLTL